ncbi:MAG: CDP-alcohol phosphatidyltransferase family protein [Pseudomonadota bacterium]
MTEARTLPKLRLVGSVDAGLFSLPMEEWQRRAWGKQGVATGNEAAGELVVGMDWVLSPSLARALATTPGAALVAADGRLAAVHVPTGGNVTAVGAMIEDDAADEDALRQLGLAPGTALDLAGTYNQALRKKEMPYALSMHTTAPRDIEKRLFAGSYKGATDLVTKYVWPLPALHVTRACAALGISPNMVTTVSLILVFVAMWCFAEGWWIAGFLSGWLMTFLDTVDGKLARTTMTYSKWGNVYDHGIDLIHPPFWYWTWYIGLVATMDVVPTWLWPAFLIIVIGYVAGRLLEGLFMWRNGIEGHIWKPIDSFVREIIARRNPNMLIFMVLTLMGRPDIGFGLVAVWTILSTVFQVVRLAQSFTLPKAAVTSWMDA